MTPPRRRAVRPDPPPDANRERVRALLAALRRLALELEAAWPGGAAPTLRAMARGIAEGAADLARPRKRWRRGGIPGSRHGKPTQHELAEGFLAAMRRAAACGASPPTVAGFARSLADWHGGAPANWARKIRRGLAKRRQAQAARMLALMEQKRNEP